MNSINESTIYINDAIFSITLHFMNLDKKLHETNRLYVKDIANELFIDVCDEEKDLFYCSTFIEKLKEMMEKRNQTDASCFDVSLGDDSYLYYGTLTKRYFHMSKEELEKAMNFMKELAFDSENTDQGFYDNLEEAFDRYNDKEALHASFNNLIDIFKQKKFLSTGDFAHCFNMSLGNEYVYCIGDKKLYRQWLDELCKSYEDAMAKSNSLEEICKLLVDSAIAKTTLDDFDKNNK